MDQLKFLYSLYADRKPIAICEYAATHFCQASGKECRDFAVKSMQEMYGALPKQFPRVVMISWFSVEAASDRLAHNEYAVTTDPLVLATYQELIASPYFLPATGAPATGPLPTPGAPVITPPVPAAPTGPAVTPRFPFPFEGQAVPGPRELALSLYGASPRAASGKVSLDATAGSQLQVDTLTFYLDGEIRCITNFKPYTWEWTIAESAGEHVVKIVATAPDGENVATLECSVIVAAPPPTS
jgi:hypothetical protein